MANKVSDAIRRGEYTFHQYVDLSNVRDSMEINSNTMIACLVVGPYEAYLETRGEVKVYWDNDGAYNLPSGFPPALKRLIHEHPGDDWMCDPRVYVSMNNWIEAFVLKNGQYVCSDVVDAECMSRTEVFDLLVDWAETTELYHGEEV